MQIKAPVGFQPQDVKQRPLPPAPCRSRYRKFDIYRDVQQFHAIDNHAIQVAQQDHDNFMDLIWHLVYSQKNIQTELDKARVIFRWMTSKNMYTIQFRDGAPAGSPEEVLLSFKNKQGTYARIFETLCRYADLHCSVMTGYAKGLDYRPGDPFKTNDYNHSWNGVLIDGNWYLVDSHWATRYLTSEKNKPENLVYEYDDFYFLTDPEQLIYSHWAHKQEWQLLSRNLSLKDFENLPLVKSYFFKCGMFFISHHMGVVNTNKGCIALTLGHGKPTNFTYKITFADSNDETYQGQKLKNYSLQEHGRNQTSTFIFRAPRVGQYYFTIFAQLLTGELGVKNVFTASAEYKVLADQSAVDAVPLPNCSDSSWGPGVAVDQMGLVASPPQGIIACGDGKVKLEFKKTRPAYILAKLRKNGMRDEELESCIHDDDQNDKVVVTADLPQKGEYGIEIYGNDPSRDGDTYTHICQYYVHYADPSEQDKAFYQESPDSRVYMGGPRDTMDSRGDYSPDSRGVEVPDIHSPVVRGASSMSSGETDKQLTSGVNQMHVTPGENFDPNDLPPPPPEMLQQQYLYGTVPDSRQQPVFNQQAYPGGQARQGYAPGTGVAENINEPAHQAQISNLPPSKPYEVEKRTIGQPPPVPPKHFKLVPIRTESDVPAPVPAAAQQPKPSLDNIDRQVLETVDDHAIQVSKSEHNSFKDLVWDLIYSKNITNEIEKVRVIFRWLATKNLKEMNFDNVEKGSPEEVLMGLKTGKTTYAMVFDTMCNYAGLHSKIISGYAKGADYRPGQKFVPGSNQHSWNAVYIYGTWCLIDAHWAARRIIGKQATTEEFHYQLDEYFFLPDPHQLIYTHMPDDSKWQLLDRQITLQEFENMPHMKPQFFKYGLEFVTHRTAVIYSHGEINIRLRYQSHKIAVAFNFTIAFENGEEEYNGLKLSRYGLQESTDGIASFRLRLPVKESYILYIYAKEDTPDNKENVYAQVCEYKIVQEEVPVPAPEPFPPCSYLTWGPGTAFYKYGLATYQKTATIMTRDGKVELQIKLPKNMQFMGKLKNNTISDSELEGYIIQRNVGNTAFFDVTSPGRGEYGLEIYANDPETEGTTLYHVGQYLIVCDEECHAIPLPKLSPGYLGAQPKFGEYGLQLASHFDPIIHLDTNTVTIVMKSENMMRVTANLISADDDKKDFPENVFSHIHGSNITFIVNLPCTGFFKLQLYAVPVSDKSQQIPGVYNYLIQCRKVTQAVFPFPKQYAQWKEGCFMKEPGIIPTTRSSSGQQVSLDRLPATVNFCVSIPNADAVAVVISEDPADKWTHLQRAQGDEWSGIVEVAPYYGTNTKITLNANYGGDKSSYCTLLEYFI